MTGAVRIIPSQPLGFLAPKTASGGKIRAHRVAPERMPRNRLYRLRKTRSCNYDPAGPHILGNTIGNAVAGDIAQSSAPQLAYNAGGLPDDTDVTGGSGGGGGSGTGPAAIIIQQGQDLSSIASSHGTTVAALVAANAQITNQDQIDEGASLTLPQGVSPIDGDATEIVVTGNSTLHHLLSNMNTSTFDNIYAKIDNGWRANQALDELQDPDNRYSIVGSEIDLAANLDAQGAFAPMINYATYSNHAIGVWGGYSAEAGIISVNVAHQRQWAHMTFPNGETAILRTTGSLLGGPGYGWSNPNTASPYSNSEGGEVAGGSAGAGGGFVYSNAIRPSDLAGPGRAWNLNFLMFGGSVTTGDNGIYSVNAGIAKGWGLDLSHYATNTKVSH